MSHPKISPQRVRELREQNWLTQQELADAVGVSLFTVQRMERGDGGVRPSTARMTAQVLGVTPNDLTEEPEAPKEAAPHSSAEASEERRTPVEESERSRIFLSRRFGEFEEQARKIAAGEATPLTAPSLVLAMEEELRRADKEGLPASVIGDYMDRASKLTQDVRDVLEKQERELYRGIVEIRERQEYFAARGESEDPQRVEAS